MPIFIKFSNKERELFFNKLKNKINKSWEKFYPKYKISRTMFFNYLSGRYDLPKILFDKWNKIVRISTNNLEKINKEKYTKKNLPKIKVNIKLAEIFGALNGDGHISKCGKEVCIVCDAREKDYLIYLKGLCEKTFRLNFTFFHEPTKIKLRTYSTELSKLLTESYGLPKGNKIGKLKIPESIKNSKSFLISYLRGLFDTDGSIYIRRKKDLVVNLSNADKRFLLEIAEALRSMGFSVCVNRANLFIYNQEQIRYFFKLIKPSNNKHLKKFQMYSR